MNGYKIILTGILGVVCSSIVGGLFFLLSGKQANISLSVNERTNNTQSSITAITPSEVPGNLSDKTFSFTDVSTHNTKSDCWLIIDGSVYNVTSFIPNHPGGDEIVKGCGKDATRLFSREREHAEQNASALLPEYLIGTIN